jgi:hypothetical protein
MLHRRLGKVSPQDRCQDVHRDVLIEKTKKSVWIRDKGVKSKRRREGTIFDEVVLCQTLEAGGTCKALCEKESDCRGKSFPLLCLPLVDILQECRKRVLFKRLLEILVSDSFLVNAAIPARLKDYISPPD